MGIHHKTVANPVIEGETRFFDLSSFLRHVTAFQDENDVGEETGSEIRSFSNDAFLLQLLEMLQNVRSFHIGLTTKTIFLRHGPRYGVEFDGIHIETGKHVWLAFIVEALPEIKKYLLPLFVVFICNHFVPLELFQILLLGDIVPHGGGGALLPLCFNIHVKTKKLSFVDHPLLW